MTRQETQTVIKLIMEQTAAAHPELRELTQMVIEARLTPQQLTEVAASLRQTMQ